MKVVFASANINMGSGASWSFLGLVKCLKDDGIQPVVILRKKGGLYDELKNINIKIYILPQEMHRWMQPVGVPSKISKHMVKCDIKNFISLIRCILIIVKEKPDLIHMNSLTEYMCGVLGEKMRIPVIWHIREFMEEDLGVEFCNKEKALKIVGNASEIIAISKSVKDKFELLLNRNVKMIYNGIYIDDYYFEHSIFENKIINIAISGRICKQKGHLELFRAVKLLIVKGITNIRLNIYGEVDEKNDYYQKLKKYIENNNLSDYVIFRGYFHNMSKELRKMDIQCVCSIKEAFGRVTIEGMLSGLLMIGANSGGTAELIEDGETGYLYEVGNEKSLAMVLEKSILNKGRSSKIARYAQSEAALKFSDKTNAQLIKELYNKVLNGFTSIKNRETYL